MKEFLVGVDRGKRIVDYRFTKKEISVNKFIAFMETDFTGVDEEGLIAKDKFERTVLEKLEEAYKNKEKITLSLILMWMMKCGRSLVGKYRTKFVVRIPFYASSLVQKENEEIDRASVDLYRYIQGQELIDVMNNAKGE